MRSRQLALLLISCAGWAAAQTPPTDKPPAVTAELKTSQASPAEVQAVLNKFCAGCHNETDPEGDFSVSSLSSVRAGTPEGLVVEPGQPNKSKLLDLLSGKQEPRMPPEDEPQPTAEDVALLSRWIEEGALAGSSSMETERRTLAAPQLTPAAAKYHYVGAACGVGSAGRFAIGGFGQVVLHDPAEESPVWTTTGLNGKVNSLRLSPDGRWIVVGSGVAGLGGEAVLLDVESGKVVQRFIGHEDSIYCAAVSPDATLLATGSYDRKVILWDTQTGRSVRELTGHNGAIYDLDFDPSGQLLATASGDQTIKLWRVADGLRLDTLGQPEGEQRCVRFSPDGRFVVAGGADKQIRKWQLVARQAPAINPMLVARYAHESDVLQLAFLGPDRLLSASADRTIKLWEAELIAPLGSLAQLAEVPVGLCVWPETSATARVVDLRGTHQMLDTQSRRSPTRSPEAAAESQSAAASVASTAGSDPAAPQTPRPQTEQEPNQTAVTATAIELPAEIAGTIAAPEAEQDDWDTYSFSAQQGEQWIFEVAAARNQSPLDSRIDIVDAQGQPVLRTRLQATRESYLTFRGKDSSTSDDFRLHKWEDMELDEFLYTGGEINRLWLYPRGPDSGFKVYPGAGSRYAYFDSTPLAHALGATAYIVRELAAGEEPLPNGLPVFSVYYENDDDSLQRWGKDSRLTFTAPADGRYFVRVRDARGFGGPDYNYSLTIRQPQPDFSLSLSGQKMSLPRGSGREWSVRAERRDGLEAPIAIELSDLPPGLIATNPVIIEAGQETALGCLFVSDDLAYPSPTPEDRRAVDSAPDDSSAKDSAAEDSSTEKTTTEKNTTEQNTSEEKAAGKEEPAGSETSPAQSGAEAAPPAGTKPEPQGPAAQPQTFTIGLTARCQVDGRELVKELPEKLEVTITQGSEVQLRLVDAQDATRELQELSIRPGQTISARVVVERNGLTSRIGLGKEDSGRNLPHGAFVDNIGLNGLLITEEQSEREFFITAAPKLQPGRHQFHLRSETAGNPTSQPIWLNVLPAKD